MNPHRSRNLTAFVLAGLTFLLGVPCVAAVLFFPVILVAGPHSDMLPSMLQAPILIMAWLAVVALPAWLARRVYRRFLGAHTRRTNGTTSD